MADITFTVAGGAIKRLRDMGDGTHAEVVAAGSFPAQGYTATATFTPAAAAYLAGDVMDVAKSMAWVDKDGVAVPANSLVRVLTAIIKIGVTSVPAGQTSYSLACFSVTPPSAQADNAAYSLAAGDLASYLGKFSLGTPVDEGDALYIKTQYVDFDMRLVGTGFYAELITDGAHTPAAVARTIILHGVVL